MSWKNGPIALKTSNDTKSYLIKILFLLFPQSLCYVPISCTSHCNAFNFTDLAFNTVVFREIICLH